jgi:hypothetical protein
MWCLGALYGAKLRAKSTCYGALSVHLWGTNKVGVHLWGTNKRL